MIVCAFADQQTSVMGVVGDVPVAVHGHRVYLAAPVAAAADALTTRNSNNTNRYHNLLHLDPLLIHECRQPKFETLPRNNTQQQCLQHHLRRLHHGYKYNRHLAW